MSNNELFKTIEAQGKLITELSAKLEDFECYLINILDSDELTDTEKVELIKEQF